MGGGNSAPQIAQTWIRPANSNLELVAQTNTGIVVVGAVATAGLNGVTHVVDDEVVRKATIDLLVHHAGIHIHVLGEAPIDHQRDRIQRTSARVGGSSQNSAVGQNRGTRGIGILPLVIVSTGDVER